MVYHIKALSRLSKFSIFFPRSVEKNRFEIFDFWPNFELISKVVSNCNSLFKLNLSRENLFLLNSAILGIKN